MIKWVFVFALLSGLSLGAFAQDDSEDRPTTATAVEKKVNMRKYEPKVKNYDVIYKRSTKKTLYGNPCAIDVTHKMGFEYVPLTNGRGKTKMGIILNNSFVGTRLFFTHTPAWKLILKKRLKDCRLKSGDGIG